MRPSYSPRAISIEFMRGGSKQTENEPIWQGILSAILAGIVISIVLCPVMIGFCSIIFSHSEFQVFIPLLIKLIFMSSIIHQVVMTIWSPVPYAIAQVQDSGLIFLSAMATSIMESLGPNTPLDEKLATVLIQLSLSSAIVGIALLITGKLKLAGVVQYLPMPVIGGYLAYIGFFMVQAGLALMTNLHLSGFRSWSALTASWHTVMLFAPGLIAGVLLSFLTAKYQHFAFFPSILLSMPILFYLILCGILQYTVSDLQNIGFLAESGPSISVMDAYELFEFNKVHWEVLIPSQLPTMFSMYLLIAFASSLDIASISMGTNATYLNYNTQLSLIGFSNFVSGICGGYTGSYIFSQTVFSYRFHPSKQEKKMPGISRIIGISLICCEFGIVLLPFSILSVVPKFVFGAVMVFIGVELIKTWLVLVYFKLLSSEYLIVISTFFCLQFLGVQYGLVTGIAIAAFRFIYEISMTQVVNVVHKSSNVVYNAEQHALLFQQPVSSSEEQQRQQHRPSLHLSSTSTTNTTDNVIVMRNKFRKYQSIVTFELQGHLFFGSSIQMMEIVKKSVCVVSLTTTKQSTATNSSKENVPRSVTMSLTSSNTTNVMEKAANLLHKTAANLVQTPSSIGSSARKTTNQTECLPLLNPQAQERDNSKDCTPQYVDLNGDIIINPAISDCHTQKPQQQKRVTRFVIFDFQNVSGMDVTAVRTCFMTLKFLFQPYHIRVVYCGLSLDMEYLLKRNDVITPFDKYAIIVKDLDLALELCEEEILAVLQREEKRKFKENAVLRPIYMNVMNNSPIQSPMELQRKAKVQSRDTSYCNDNASNSSSSNAGNNSDEPLDLDRILVAYTTTIPATIAHSTKDLAIFFQIQTFNSNDIVFKIGDESNAWYILLQGQITLLSEFKASRPKKQSPTTTSSGLEVLRRVRRGCIFGDLDFYLNQLRSIQAVVTADKSAIIAFMTRETVNNIMIHHKEKALCIQEIIIRAAFMGTSEHLSGLVV